MTTDAIRVELVYALPTRYWRIAMSLPMGATVSDALVQGAPQLQSLLPSEEGLLDWSRLAVFSRPATPSTVLRDGDRLEVLRPLVTDPKQGRRDRAEPSPRKR